ncbi:hypothetical protein PYW08_002927 [Mythimna loreyi]|uniref:Uncharacterized protein n=1 Tax=Mythimna loreyi TaxID=667449 RepID=A0ACC2QJC0_9NEOP|nr:hypothetical protein PYW08_002927 [Mythimna loreyi]
MEDLIPPQIKDNCKLALPDGLKELMSDITREVLRYQPRDLYKFIADYLAAMLVTRDNLSIAGYICNHMFQCSCEPELLTELRDILVGMPEDEIKAARDIIVKYFEKGTVNEGNLVMILMKDTKIHEDLLPAVLDAIRNAYRRHQAHQTTKYESSSEDEQDGMMCAAKHTLDLYRKTNPNEETYSIMAEKIQKSYRAYGVTRETKSKQEKPSTTVEYPRLSAETSSSFDIYDPEMTYTSTDEDISASNLEVPMVKSQEEIDVQKSSTILHKRISTMSSTSLAGSFVNLPYYKPYSAHDDILSNLEEFPEKEHAHIDYTNVHPHISMVTEDKLFYKKEKKISFSEAEKSLGLGAQDDLVSRDSNVTVATGFDGLFCGDVMTVDSYDADSELDKSDINVAEDQGSLEINEVKLET